MRLSEFSGCFRKCFRVYVHPTLFRDFFTALLHSGDKSRRLHIARQPFQFHHTELFAESDAKTLTYSVVKNLPKSSGHGNGIAVFFARCCLLSRITRQLIVAFRSSSWRTYRLKRCRCSPLPNAFRFSHTVVNAPVV